MRSPSRTTLLTLVWAGVVLAGALLTAIGLGSLSVESCFDNPDISVPEASSCASTGWIGPFGYHAQYTLPGGAQITDEPSFSTFLTVLLGELVVVALLARRWPRLGPATRRVAAGAVALMTVGCLAAVAPDFVFVFFFGFVIGVPLAILADRLLTVQAGESKSLQGSAAAASFAAFGLLTAALLWLLGLGVAAFGLALALTVPLARLTSGDTHQVAGERG